MIHLSTVTSDQPTSLYCTMIPSTWNGTHQKWLHNLHVVVSVASICLLTLAAIARALLTMSQCWKPDAILASCADHNRPHINDVRLRTSERLYPSQTIDGQNHPSWELSPNRG